MADVIFTGNLGSDSELRFTPSGSAVLNFRAADSKSKRNDQGGWDTITEQWFNVSIWGSMAEYLADKALKGVRVKVYGEFYQRAYEGKNGPGISLDVKASAVEIMTPKSSRPQGDSPSASYGTGSYQNQAQQQSGGFGGFGQPQGGNFQQQPQTQGGWGGQQPAADPWAAPSEPPF